MKEFSKFFALKNIKLILGLYLAVTMLLILDAYLLRLTILATVGRFLWFLPFVLLMLLFCLVAVKTFERKVKKQEEKYNATLKFGGSKTLCASKKIFWNNEWLVIAGKTAYYFAEIAEMGDAINCAGLKPGGVCKMAVKLQNGKTIYIQGDDLGKLSLLKSAFKKHRDQNEN